MKKTNKYESPVIREIETKLEGFICQSCTTDSGGGHGYGGDAPANDCNGMPSLPFGHS